jgi:hypothetical protein
MKLHFKLPNNYDFKVDIDDKKHKKEQNSYKKYSLQKQSNGNTAVETIFVNNRSHLFKHYKAIIPK